MIWEIEIKDNFETYRESTTAVKCLSFFIKVKVSRSEEMPPKIGIFLAGGALGPSSTRAG